MNSIKFIFTLFAFFLFSKGLVSQDYTYMKSGKLYMPNGKEMAIFGVNFQPNLSWEYNRLRKIGVKLSSEELKKVTDESFKELELMNISSIRCHLTPGDFVDFDGNIVETVYLDILDYMTAEALKRGIYVTIAFINHMGSAHIQNSMWAHISREEWMYNKEVVEKSKKYIAQLLNRRNPYINTTYKETTNIAMWEIINEPSVYSYDAIQNTVYFDDFLFWLKCNGKRDSKQAYLEYREELVHGYINAIYKLIRDTGAKQPVAWSLNWHRYMRDHEDVFHAAATSDVEVVAMCNYPGQDLVGKYYGRNPKDLTKIDFTEWFKTYYNDETGYGWALSDLFKNKAKVVYEFETFFNQSSYLYPIQAQYFRALGVQAAQMWTYSLSAYAPYSAGSHVLSLTCTPRKAAGFIVANEIFRTTRLYEKYPIDSPNEQVTNHYAISKKRDISIYSDADKFYYSGDVTNWNPLTINDNVKEVMGYGSSSLVKYNGTGLYFIKEESGKLLLTILPDVEHIKNQWDSRQEGIITQLNYQANNKITILLKGWNKGNYSIYRVEEGVSIPYLHRNKDLANIPIHPGKYIIIKEF